MSEQKFYLQFTLNGGSIGFCDAFTGEMLNDIDPRWINVTKLRRQIEDRLRKDPEMVVKIARQMKFLFIK